MATDGVKIIDGDLAHDTYTILLDKFDRGIDIETIKNEFLAENDLHDGFDYEIFITAYALGLWEVGHLDSDTLNEVLNTINKGVCIKKWAEWDKSLGKAREKVLEKFITKISTPKKNPRKVKRFRSIQNILFEEGDVLTFKIDDKFYSSIIITTEKIRNYCIYRFAITDFVSAIQPTINNVIKSNIIVSKVGCWETEESINQRQPGLKEIFGSLTHELNTKFFIGLIGIDIEHRKLNKFSLFFQKIGTLKIIEGYKYRSGGGYDESLEQFSFSIQNYIENYTAFRYYKIGLSKIVDNGNS